MEDGRDAAGEASRAEALYANRRRVRGRRGRRLQRCRGEVVERTFAHMYETGACAGCGCAVTRMCASGC